METLKLKPENSWNRTWTQLFALQTSKLDGLACFEFWRGLDQLGFGLHFCPDIASIEKRLHESSGWRLKDCQSMLPEDQFFDGIEKQIFPVISWLRDEEQLLWSDEPDYWHDVFGHLPLLTDSRVQDLYLLFGKLARSIRLHHPEHLTSLARIYWYSIEFGLIKQNSELKVYGAGLLPSPKAIDLIRARKIDATPFEISKVIEKDFDSEELQTELFYINSWQDLYRQIIDWANKENLL